MRAILSCVVLLVGIVPSLAETREDRVAAILRTHDDAVVRTYYERLTMQGPERIELAFNRSVRVAPMCVYLAGRPGDEHILLAVDPVWLERPNVSGAERQLAMVYAAHWIGHLDQVRLNLAPNQFGQPATPWEPMTPRVAGEVFKQDLLAMLAMCQFATERGLTDATELSRSYAQHGRKGLVSVMLTQATRVRPPSDVLAPELREEYEQQLLLAASSFLAPQQ
jgi:hypothetical protein